MRYQSGRNVGTAVIGSDVFSPKAISSPMSRTAV